MVWIGEGGLCKGLFAIDGSFAGSLVWDGRDGRCGEHGQDTQVTMECGLNLQEYEFVAQMDPGWSRGRNRILVLFK